MEAVLVQSGEVNGHGDNSDLLQDEVETNGVETTLHYEEEVNGDGHEEVQEEEQEETGGGTYVEEGGRDEERGGNNLEEVEMSGEMRSEIEGLVKEQLQSYSDEGKLQPLTDLLTLRQRFGNGYTYIPHVHQICDIHGTDCLNYGKSEKLFRCKLASFYRLIDLCGWSSNLDLNMTACFTGEGDVLMAPPDGLMFSEVTASSLVKLDRNGLIPDSTHTDDTDIDEQLYSLNFTIHSARPDVMCVAHLTSPDAFSISVMKTGLLLLGPEAAMLGKISYFEFEDSIHNEREYSRLVNELGSTSKVLVVRNYGVLVCGETVEEAFHLSMLVMSAIETQMNLLAVGLDNLCLLTDDLLENMYENGHNPAVCSAEQQQNSSSRWKMGEREFEAMMRQLDSAGYCTGYVYHEPLAGRAARLLNQQSQTTQASYTTSYLQQSLITDQPVHTSYSRAPSSRDNRTPSFLHHEPPLSGRSTPNPKLARWLSDSPAPVKPTTPIPRPETSMNQFAPRSINPTELRDKIKEIKRDYYADRVTAGPQSRILEGITWDEAKVAKSTGDGKGGGVGDGIVISASKGIIQREHQHAVVGFKKPDPPNPFNSLAAAEEEARTIQQEQEYNNSSNSQSVEPPPSSIGTVDCVGQDSDVIDTVTRQDDDEEEE